MSLHFHPLRVVFVVVFRPVLSILLLCVEAVFVPAMPSDVRQC